MYKEAKQLVTSKAIGELKLVTASFGLTCKSVDRIKRLDLGGGGLLDIGIYCLTIVDIFFDGQDPIKITANGFKTDTGVDETLCINFMFSGNKMAQVMTSTGKKIKHAKCCCFA